MESRVAAAKEQRATALLEALSKAKTLFHEVKTVPESRLTPLFFYV
jgi:hypothetical protein